MFNLLFLVLPFSCFSVGNTQKEMCNRSTLCFIQRKNTEGFYLKNIYVIKCKACVLEGSSQSSGFITTLRTDVDVDWTKAETSPHHQDMMDFPLTQDQPVDSDLRTSHCVNVTHHQWHQRPHMCLNGTLIVFSPLFVRLSSFLSFLLSFFL